MRARSAPTPSEHISRRAAALAATALAACALAAGGCVGRAPSASELLAEAARLEAALRASAPPLAPRALRIRLAFGEGADLDLYVTDPLQETVYFANTPARSGGVLDADRACDDEPPRIETVEFAAPLPGRYRIGVDHAASCSDARATAAFALAVEHAGRAETARGALPFQRFDPIVLEVDVPPLEPGRAARLTPARSAVPTPPRASARGACTRARCGSP